LAAGRGANPSSVLGFSVVGESEKPYAAEDAEMSSY